jgi:hypothetical protein
VPGNWPGWFTFAYPEVSDDSQRLRVRHALVDDKYFFFVGENFDRLYENENRMFTIAGLFSILAIIIACLGLFALASFIVSQRTKEIGPAFPFIILRKGGARFWARRSPAWCSC